MSELNVIYGNKIKLKNKFVAGFVDKYIHNFRVMTSSCSAIIQIVFCLSYPECEGVCQKYEHIQIFNYNFKRCLSSVFCPGSEMINSRVVWFRGRDLNRLPYFQFVVLVESRGISHFRKVIEIAKQCWAMTLGLEDFDLFSIDYSKDDSDTLHNGLIYDKNYSEFEMVRTERCMLQQVLSLAKLIDQEIPCKNGWMKRSNRPGELRHIL